MPECQKNIWAPWRMNYILGDEPTPEGCFLCHYRDHADADVRNFVLFRSDSLLVVLNRFPYSNGHVLVAPTAHEGRLEALPDTVLTELIVRVRDVQRVLRDAIRAEGFNIGINLGSCAGAGVPDHLHWHVVPRWTADTNFMPVLSDVKVMPDALENVAACFQQTADRLGLFGV